MQRLEIFSYKTRLFENISVLVMLNMVIILIMSGVKERLLRFIQESKISTAEFERTIGVSSGYVNNISKSIQPDKLEIISEKFPDLNIEWLLIGKGSMIPLSEADYMSDLFYRIEELSIKFFSSDNSVHSIDFEKMEKYTEIPMKRLHDIIIGGKYPKYEEVYKIANAKALNISEEWLFAGEGKMLRKKASKPYETFVEPPLEVGEPTAQYSLEKEQTRPRIPYAAAAGSLTSSMNGITAEQCEQIPIIKIFPVYDFTIFIKGDSMFPRYESGDEVACKRIDESKFIQWGKVHVMDTSQGIIIKRIYDAGGEIRCNSFNPDYPDFTIPKVEIHSMSLVVGLVRL